jgi:hypothetical protein
MALHLSVYLIFQSSQWMAQGSTQPLTEMNTKILPWDEELLLYKADTFTAICEPIVYKMWEYLRFTAL